MISFYLFFEIIDYFMNLTEHFLKPLFFDSLLGFYSLSLTGIKDRMNTLVSFKPKLLTSYFTNFIVKILLNMKIKVYQSPFGLLKSRKIFQENRNNIMISIRYDFDLCLRH